MNTKQPANMPRVLSQARCQLDHWRSQRPNKRTRLPKEFWQKAVTLAKEHGLNKGEVDKAIKALAVYEVGKPLVVEEMFPLRCSKEELDVFIDASRKIADGWISFYWGKTIDEYAEEDLDLAGAITKSWLEHFRAKAPTILREQKLGSSIRK